jgi:hypothetical protein
MRRSPHSPANCAVRAASCARASSRRRAARRGGLPEGAELRAQAADSTQGTAAPSAGIFRLAVAVGNAIKPITDVNLISLRPRADKRNGRVGLYYIGNWPGETGASPRRSARRPTAIGPVRIHRGDAGERRHARLGALPAA